MGTFETIDTRCRICALNLSDLTCSIAIFGEQSASFHLQRKIEKYLQITVLEDDLLPKNICATCFLKIESIDKFAFSAAKNQESFLQWIQSSRNSKMDQNVTQTTIETSTNSDFSFSNITIKKEYNQRQQIIFQPQKSRNARHVDHITLEQIINDQIIKNPKLPASTTITKIDEPKRPRVQPPQQQQQSPAQSRSENTNISIVSYNNLQIGQVIKDYEFLKLILRALKWEEYDRKTSYHELMERLKRSYCRDILTNKNLLSDNDVVQLLRSTLNDSVLSNLKMTTTPTVATPSTNAAPLNKGISKIILAQPVVIAPVPSPVTVVQLPIKSPVTVNSNVPEKKVVILPVATKSVIQKTQQTEEAMEVSIDPEIYLDEPVTIDDDEDEEEKSTTSAMQTKIEKEKSPEKESLTRNNGNYICSSCPQKFTSSTDLQNHVTDHLISSSTQDNNNVEKPDKSAIEKTPTKKKKIGRDERLNRPKRKSFILKINPSPVKVKRLIKERPKPQAAPSPFSCLICSKSLSSKRNLLLHIEMHKTKSGKFQCDVEGCKKFFGKIENVVKHKSEAHLEKTVRRKRNQNEK